MSIECLGNECKYGLYCGSNFTCIPFVKEVYSYETYSHEGRNLFDGKFTVRNWNNMFFITKYLHSCELCKWRRQLWLLFRVQEWISMHQQDVRNLQKNFIDIVIRCTAVPAFKTCKTDSECGNYATCNCTGFRNEKVCIPSDDEAVAECGWATKVCFQWEATEWVRLSMIA